MQLQYYHTTTYIKSEIRQLGLGVWLKCVNVYTKATHFNSENHQITQYHIIQFFMWAFDYQKLIYVLIVVSYSRLHLHIQNDFG